MNIEYYNFQKRFKSILYFFNTPPSHVMLESTAAAPGTDKNSHIAQTPNSHNPEEDQASGSDSFVIL